jgi:VanZ family protein
LPSLLWTAIVLAASSDLFSAAHTGGVLAAILRAVAGHDVSGELFAVIHYLIRKLAHLTEYGIASVLYFRALRNPEVGAPATSSRHLSLHLLAVLIVLLVAAIDEFHQSFVASRTGSPADVLLDVTGGTIAQFLLLWESRRRVNC